MPAPIRVRRDAPNVPGAVFKFGLSDLLYGADRDEWDRRTNWFDGLARLGLTVATWSMPGDTFADIYPSAEEAFERFLSATANRAHGAPSPVALLAHSRGGLVARKLLKDHGTRGRVRWLITLGSPHRGSELARPGRNLGSWWPTPFLTESIDDFVHRSLGAPGDEELAPDSALLRDLVVDEEPLPNVLYYTVAGTSPKFAKAYAWTFDAMSAVPQWDSHLDTYFIWTANPIQIAALLNDPGHLAPFDEIKTGNGDGLVAVSRAHLPYSEPVTVHVNHAQMLWDGGFRKTVTDLFAHQPYPVWISDFTGDQRDDILVYEPDGNWRRGSVGEGDIQWSLVGNTMNFGQVWDGRPFWTGRFSRSDRQQVLFFYPPPYDGNWILGTVEQGKWKWDLAGNTAGANGHPDFGPIWDGRPFFHGWFSQKKKDDILFPLNDGWCLGQFSNASLQWKQLKNHCEAHPDEPAFGCDSDRYWTHVGRFSRVGNDTILMYRPGNVGNWWMGCLEEDALSWKCVDAIPSPPGPDCSDLDAKRIRVFAGPFTQDEMDELLLFDPVSGEWWLGELSGNMLQWKVVSDVHADWPDEAAFASVLTDGRPWWSGCFEPDTRLGFHDRSRYATSGYPNIGWSHHKRPHPARIRVDSHSILFYVPQNQTWWLGAMNDERLIWQRVGETSGFGQIWDGRPFWLVRPSGSRKASIVFYTPYNGDWFIGSMDDGAMKWRGAGNSWTAQDAPAIWGDRTPALSRR